MPKDVYVIDLHSHYELLIFNIFTTPPERTLYNYYS